MKSEPRRIELQTNDLDKVLVLDDLHFSGDSGACRLVVRNRGFCCEQRFYFDGFHLRRWMDALERMDRTLNGEAILKQEFEDDYVRWRVNDSGHVLVDGQLSRVPTHLFRFEFRTDQTCLRPFIAAAKGCFAITKRATP